MNQQTNRAWRTFANVATVFSFVVNFVLVLVLLLVISPLVQLLTDLDRAFQGLGETNIETVVDVNQPIGIAFDLPLNQPLDLNFDLPIDQDTVVIITQPVPLDNLPARFLLPGGGGAINGSVSLSLPAGTQLPVRLSMMVPVQRTIPVSLTVPVDQSVPVAMVIPVRIQLGEAGLNPAVQRLRDVFAPLREPVQALFGEPDTQ